MRLLFVLLLGACSSRDTSGPPIPNPTVCEGSAACGACEFCREGVCAPDTVSQECIAECTCSADGCCGATCSFDPDCANRACEASEELLDVGPLATRGDVDLLQAAWNGTHYALAWYDRPRGAFVAMADVGGDIVPGSLVELSPSGLFTRVDFNGREHAVVYVVEDPTAADPFDGRELVFARLDAEGRLIAGSEIVLDGGPGIDRQPQSPVIRHEPERGDWLVVWEDIRSTTVHAVRIDASGALVPDSALVLSGDGTGSLGAGGSSGAVVQWADGLYAIVWSESLPDGGVHLTRLDPSLGIVSDAIVSDGARNPMGASVAWSGDELGIAWFDATPSGERFEMHFARADADGQRIDGSELTWGEPSEHSMAGSLSWDGREYAVGWYTEHDVRVTNITREGAISETQVLTGAGRKPFFPFLTWDGCRTVVAYVNEAAGFEGHLVFLSRQPLLI
jgi:hypothetical protein